MLGRIGAVFVGPARVLRREFGFAMRTNSGRIGFVLVAIHAVLAVAGPALAPYDPTEFARSPDGGILRFDGFSSAHWLGTDQFGRDLLSRAMSGASSIIAISVLGTLLGLAAGTVVGMMSGYRGGSTDEVVMRVMDGLMSFPGLLLALLVISTLGPNRENIIITIGVVFMPRVARVMRGATLDVKTKEFVQSARLRGEPPLYIIFREILPNTLPVLGVEASVRLSYAILLAASLGFLGLGVQPPSPDWGRMISESRNFISIAPEVALVPSAAVSSLIIGVNLLADGIREAHELPSSEPQP